MRDDLQQYAADLVEALQALPYGPMSRAAELLLECQERGSTVFVLGNGGSAATASHFACDLAKGTRVRGIPTFRVIPLTDNVPLLTAWGNDVGYDCVFAEQLAALVRPHDVVVVISASGNSPNVLAAAEVAARVQATTISLTGRSGGKLRALSDLTIRVPSDSIEQVEDAHLVIAHAVCVGIRRRLSEGLLEVEERLIDSSASLPRLVK